MYINHGNTIPNAVGLTYYKGALYGKICMFSQLEVQAMRRDAQDANIRRCKSEGKTMKNPKDQTPLGFLTYLVTRGHLVDLANVIIGWGCTPKKYCNDNTAQKRYKQFKKIHDEVMNKKEGGKVNAEVNEYWSLIKSATKVTQKEGQVKKAKFDEIRTIDANLKTTTTRHPETLALLLSAHQAYLCQNYINGGDQDITCAEVYLRKGEYWGNYTGNHTKRPSSINATLPGSPTKPEDKLNIELFERRYDATRALTMVDLAAIVLATNFRSGIPRAHERVIKSIIQNKRNPLNPAIDITGGELEEWTLDVTSTEESQTGNTGIVPSKKRKQEAIDSATNWIGLLKASTHKCMTNNMSIPKPLERVMDKFYQDMENSVAQFATGAKKGKRAKTVQKNDKDEDDDEDTDAEGPVSDGMNIVDKTEGFNEQQRKYWNEMASFFSGEVVNDNTDKAMGATKDHVKTSLLTRYGIDSIEWKTNDEATFEMEEDSVLDIKLIFEGGEPEVNWDDDNKENFKQLTICWKMGQSAARNDGRTMVTLIRKQDTQNGSEVVAGKYGYNQIIY